MWSATHERRLQDEVYQQSKREWARANRDIVRASSRRWREANPDKHREAGRVWANANQERIREVGTAWRKAHKPELVLKEARRRARKRLSSVGVVTRADLESKAAFWGFRCWMCRGAYSAWDHVKPLAVGGPHVLANLRPACTSCNSSKGARWRGVGELASFERAQTEMSI